MAKSDNAKDAVFTVYADDQGDAPLATQNVYAIISDDDFVDALGEAIEERKRRGDVTLRQIIAYRRARRNPRALRRLRERVLQDVPVTVYAGPFGIDWESFLDWLVENLPTILELLVQILPLFLI